MVLQPENRDFSDLCEITSLWTSPRSSRRTVFRGLWKMICYRLLDRSLTTVQFDPTKDRASMIRSVLGPVHGRCHPQRLFTRKWKISTLTLFESAWLPVFDCDFDEFLSFWSVFENWTRLSSKCFLWLRDFISSVYDLDNGCNRYMFLE